MMHTKQLLQFRTRDNSSGSQVQWNSWVVQHHFKGRWKNSCEEFQMSLSTIDDLLIHSRNHEDHQVYLEKVLQRLEENHMKLNIEKCFFGNSEVSYLGFVLTPEGIKPGRDKLRAIKAAQTPTDMKAVRSFIGLCNFFRTHIKNFATVSAPLTKLTRKDSGYNGKPLPQEALNPFLKLKKRLIKDQVVAYPRSNRKYVLITDASNGTDKIVGGFGAILTQVDEKGNYHVITYGSRQ